MLSINTLNITNFTFLIWKKLTVFNNFTFLIWKKLTVFKSPVYL